VSQKDDWGGLGVAPRFPSVIEERDPKSAEAKPRPLIDRYRWGQPLCRGEASRRNSVDAVEIATPLPDDGQFGMVETHPPKP